MRTPETVRPERGAIDSMPTGARDTDLERAILALLDARRPGASICPSEVARRVAPDDWRPLMTPVREAAARLASRGAVVATRGGQVVDPTAPGGPIRLRRADPGDSGASPLK